MLMLVRWCVFQGSFKSKPALFLSSLWSPLDENYGKSQSASQGLVAAAADAVPCPAAMPPSWVLWVGHDAVASRPFLFKLFECTDAATEATGVLASTMNRRLRALRSGPSDSQDGTAANK